MTKEYCFKIPSSHMPSIQNALKGKAVTFGKVYEEPPGSRWFHASFSGDQDDEFLAYMYLCSYDEIRA